MYDVRLVHEVSAPGNSPWPHVALWQYWDKEAYKSEREFSRLDVTQRETAWLGHTWEDRSTLPLGWPR